MSNEMQENEKSLGKKILEIPYWYHRIELPNGNVTPGWSPIDPEKYGVPSNLKGKRILDIGAWDGYWTWEALKRGASEVVAIDDFSDTCGLPDMPQRKSWDTFDLCREAFGFDIETPATKKTNPSKIDIEGKWENKKGQKVARLQMSAYEINERNLGRFDVVFFFGTIYHLKHPYVVLELISDVCDGELYIESAALDDYSPYRNLVGHGYHNNDVVMEFYPGRQYGNNENNWWCPTLQCLGAMVESVGFKNVHAWPLVESPKSVPECRGFAYGSKTGAKKKKIAELAKKCNKRQLSVGAIMSVPRLGFQDNSFCVIEGIVPLKIPLLKTQGAFWGQCLERGIQQQIDQGFDAILTIDYDTIFNVEDVQMLVKLMIEHPEADAVVPMQGGRSDMGALMTVKTKSGKVREIIQREEFAPDTIKIATGHFGLSLLRTASLLKMPHPWFIPVPAPDGQWGPGRIDDDIHFWKLMEKQGMNVLSANRVSLGHLELVIKWLDNDLKTIYQSTQDYRDNGKPKNVWR